MSATIHKISHNLEKRRILRLCTYATMAARKECRCRLSDPRRGRGPPPGQARAARSRPGAATAPNGGNLAPARSPAARSTISAREAASQRLRWPPRASHARHARLRRCCWRHGPRRPPARACGGRCGPAGPAGGPPRPASPAPLARGGGAVAPLASAPARQTGRGESRATRGRVPGGAEAAEKSSQVKSSQ